MSRSFGIVEGKIFEAEFFLQKLQLCNFIEARFYFSAFVSAARSVTFTLQASLKDVDGFSSWYARHQTFMKENQLMRFFHDARNESQKEGRYHITGGSFGEDDKGERRIKFYFSSDWADNMTYVPSEDVYSASKKFFLYLLGVVYDCFQVFGHVIDPEQYYNLKNLERLGLTVEDVEVEQGFPKGWTHVFGGSQEDRLALLKRNIPNTEIDVVFLKYLSKDRFGRSVDNIETC